MKVREGFKLTEIGEIPKEWEVDKLENLVDKITDGTHSTPNYQDEGIPFLRVTDIQKNNIDWNNVKYISQEEHLELIKRCNPEKGDILYSKNGTIGIAKIIDWDREFSIFVSLCLIKIKKEKSKINNVFLSYFLNSEKCMKQIKLRAKQGTVTNLHLEEIRELDIPIPPLSEQQKIADILSTVDEQIENVDKLIEKTKELKKGLMQRLLTKGIVHKEFKKTEIGVIPKEWEVKKLGELAEIYKGKKPKRMFKYIQEDVKRYITMEDTEVYYTDDKTCVECSKDDVIILWDGSQAGIVLTELEGYIASTMALLKFINKERNVNKYYYYYLAKKQTYIQNLTAGTGIPHVQKDIIENLLIPIPTISEQQKITDILSSVDDQLEEYQAKKEKLEILKKGLMQKLLTGKIRVKC
ncbi:hypothetical protein FDN13_02160 [Caloramator sp. E03]|uniref:restriction endonuclease subunit S n=1 Tax=Caloramator sp. E03 TaxID=2576307 RepID=UPI0011103844|nr:restriction endonuclease subunit S [Caloramator sp. E03]QCX32594.1 hypothetical protein FDN13_02160 [Caloramator sp. E03]